jgi:hypothetical protein
MNAKPPKGIYAVAVVFFVTGVLSYAQFGGMVANAAGLRGLHLGNSTWVLSAAVVALCLILYGVASLTRMHRIPQWLMFAMTLLWIIQFAMMPADSPFYSPARMYLNRLLVLLPMIASCAYLMTARVRAASRPITVDRR